MNNYAQNWIRLGSLVSGLPNHSMRGEPPHLEGPSDARDA